MKRMRAIESNDECIMGVVSLVEKLQSQSNDSQLARVI
jgi:hypothetical protein